jgi:hypothetical protein
MFGLGVEEVDHRYEASVEDAKVYVGPVSDGLDRYGRDLDDEECELRDDLRRSESDGNYTIPWVRYAEIEIRSMCSQSSWKPKPEQQPVL